MLLRTKCNKTQFLIQKSIIDQKLNKFILEIEIHYGIKNIISIIKNDK